MRQNPTEEVSAIYLCPHMIKIADNADAPFGRAARRCFACGKTCFAAALELPERFQRHKATPKRLRSRLRPTGATATRCAPKAHLRYLRISSHVSKVPEKCEKKESYSESTKPRRSSSNAQVGCSKPKAFSTTGLISPKTPICLPSQNTAPHLPGINAGSFPSLTS